MGKHDPKGSALKKMMLNTVKELDNIAQADGVAEAERWFTRAQIARKLGSSNLNPSRKGALKDLVTDKLLEERVKPTDARGTLEYKVI